ncbi:hypothetical protein N494_09340 [Clostridium botulinum A2B7 92]|uniref:hypothetical protein n=1 Tax=Clostridium botulinum TaxID=1491 RepID=UPI0007E0BE56|nr:hypothetical protein [Clostridium botulinum]KEJ01162.1 hypothetical protein N494_09340 [Clostridium botulinum A2B7 92]
MDKSNICLKDMKFNSLKEKSVIENNIIKIVSMEKRKLYLILEGESVYAKFITLPRINSKNKINELIRNELIYEFNNIDNILYSYDILKKNKTSMEGIIFCINICNNKILKKCMAQCKNIAGIYSIQFSVLNLYKEYIKEKNYIFLFKHKKYTYIILYSENNLIYSNLIYEGEKEENKIEKVLKKAEDLNITLNTIYGINIDDDSIKDKLKEYNFVSLQKFREKDYKKII